MTIFESCRSVGWNGLLALIDVRFQHGSNDVPALWSTELFLERRHDFDLILVIFLRIAMRAIDHDLLRQISLGECLADFGDVLRRVVGS